MFEIFVLEKERIIPETNSSSAHVYYFGGNDTNEVIKVREELIKFLKENNYKLVIHPLGETQFGWEYNIYKDWHSLWNWLLITAYDFYYLRSGIYKNNKIMEKLIEKIKEFTGINELNIYSKEEHEKEMVDNVWCYIDHQSVDIPIDYILNDNFSLGDILTGELTTGNDNSLY